MRSFIPVALTLALISCSSATWAFGKEEPQTPVLPNANILRDAPGRFRILSGSTISVVLDTPLNTNSATVGDSVEGHIGQAVEQDGITLIPAGTAVVGRVSAVDGPKRQLKADVSTHHWLNSQAGIDIDFYEMKLPKVGTVQIHGMPAANSLVETASPSAMKLKVDKAGDITPDFRQRKDTAIGLAITGAAIASGPIGLLLAPAAGAVAGAARPTYGLDRPTTEQDAHPRLHGMMMGALGGVPGGFLAKDAINKGADVALSAGDKIVVQLNADLAIERK